MEEGGGRSKVREGGWKEVVVRRKKAGGSPVRLTAGLAECSEQDTDCPLRSVPWQQPPDWRVHSSSLLVTPASL